MTIQELGSIGEFISSIAVLFTLIYLAVQVRQTRDATIASTMLNNRMQFQEIMLANRDSLIGPIIVKADAGEELSPEEEYRLSNHISLQWNLLFSEFVQLQIGYTKAPYTIKGAKRSGCTQIDLLSLRGAGSSLVG